MDRGINEIFSEEDLAYFGGLLQQKRDEILTKFQKLTKEYIEINKSGMADELDLATAVTEQTLTCRFLDRDNKLLKQVDAALGRINDGSYGYCEGTGEPIPKKRLEVRPWCKYSVQYKEQMERKEKRMKSNGINLEVYDD